MFSLIFISAFVQLCLYFPATLFIIQILTFITFYSLHVGTFIIYNIHRYITLGKTKSDQWSERHTIFLSHQNLLFFLNVIAFIAGAYSFLKLNLSLKKALIIPVLISLAYVFPCFKQMRLRDFPFVKILIISTIWSSFYVIPIIENSDHILLVFFEKLLFIFGLTIPFDNRDLLIDNEVGLKTISNSIGIESSIRLSKLLVFLSLGLTVFLYLQEVYSYYNLIGLIFTGLLSIFLIEKSSDKNDFYFLTYLDGMILLHGVLITITTLIQG